MRFSYRPLVAVCFGWFMVIVDATIVNVALPSLGKDLGAAVAGLQWVVDAYTVVFAGLLLAGGWLGDRFGGRPMFLTGLGIFVGASALCGLAPNLAIMITARAVQGVGAALLVPSSLALLQASYEDRAARARAIGLWAMVGGFASGCGPLLGGILIQLLGWRWIFFVNLPAGVVGFALTLRWVRARTSRLESRRLDALGQLTSMIALLAVTFGMVQSGRSGWGSAATLVPLLAGVVCLVAFVVGEARVAEPMLPLSIFRSRELSVATVVGSLMNLGFYGQLFVITLYFQQVRHLSPLLTGAALLPQTAVSALGSWLGGRVTARSGPRTPMVVGMAVGAVGFLALTALSRTIPYGLLVVPMAATGFGISFTMPAATAAAVEGAPPDRTGIAGGTLNASRQVGGAIGIALLGSFVAGGFEPGVRAAMLVAGAAFGVAAALSLLVPRLHQTAGPGSTEPRGEVGEGHFRAGRAPARK